MIRQKRRWLIQKTSCATDIAILTAQLSIISSVYNVYAAFLLEFDALSWNFPTLHLFLFISPGTYMARFPHPCFRFFTHDCQSNICSPQN
ncbi:hypothetical protein ARMGADRAFT_436822 [Armillaria gallica]|uniref:Uncharacterized protein n=1 Tax=Armillaria gallica TaxID=47427 RepID=A0A2H3DI52_ARMGA|nr:hypothetical protein ARMGADRAFT_436822 [Armillaria gallica]